MNVEIMPYTGTFAAALSEDITNFIVTDGLEEYLKDRKNGLSHRTMR